MMMKLPTWLGSTYGDTKWIGMISVLIVDDSLFVRSLVSQILQADPDIACVETASSGADALRRIPRMRPDVVTLDLSMPGGDGLTTLKRIMHQYPTPVVILSAYSKADADITIQCLEAGAIGFVLKPSGELSLDMHTVAERLLKEIKEAAQVDVEKLKCLVRGPPVAAPPSTQRGHMVVIGASTGGPQTLEALLALLPRPFAAPIIVVQHMPTQDFTQSMAVRLNTLCQMPVTVATAMEPLLAGTIYLVPGGNHMTVEPTRSKREYHCAMHRISSADEMAPSIDITMNSVASHYARNAIGVVLTGIGRDGTEGMESIKLEGGTTIAQDESALIFGMPHSVIEAGLADHILPVPQIAQCLMECVT
jgi:two-component system, chemotaxis family, protein-glutamate methylesterase/glutaminase